jgi:hypothetical protein
MDFATYWLVVPLVGLGLCWGGWIALRLTRHRDRHHHKAGAE